MGWPTLGLQDDGRRASAAISLTRPRSALRNTSTRGADMRVGSLVRVCGLVAFRQTFVLGGQGSGAITGCPRASDDQPVDRSQRQVRRRRRSAAGFPASATGALLSLLGFSPAAAISRSRLRRLRWRFVLVRWRCQEALGVLEGGAPVIAVALQVILPPPHIRAASIAARRPDLRAVA